MDKICYLTGMATGPYGPAENGGTGDKGGPDCMADGDNGGALPCQTNVEQQH